jgi:hypothetical protein
MKDDDEEEGEEEYILRVDDEGYVMIELNFKFCSRKNSHIQC